MKPNHRAIRRLERRLKTPVCRSCGRPMLAETAYIPGRGKRFRFACWTQGCPAGEWKLWRGLTISEIKP